MHIAATGIIALIVFGISSAITVERVHSFCQSEFFDPACQWCARGMKSALCVVRRSGSLVWASFTSLLQVPSEGAH